MGQDGNSRIPQDLEVNKTLPSMGLPAEQVVLTKLSEYENMLVNMENDILKLTSEIKMRQEQLDSLKTKKGIMIDDKERILGAIGGLREVINFNKVPKGDNNS